jgi:hypothetical protein
MRSFEFPFGAVATEEIPDDVFKELLVKRNKTIKNGSDFTSLIIGRRGSGKSTALKIAAQSMDKYWLHVNIDTLELYRNLVDQLDFKDSSQFKRHICARIWQKMIIDYTIYEIYKNLQASTLDSSSDDHKFLAKLTSYVSGLNIIDQDGTKKSTAFSVAYRLVKTAAKLFAQSKVGSDASEFVEDTFKDVELLWSNYETVKSETEAYLLRRKLRVVVLIDTLDELDTDDATVKLMLAGQIHALNEFKRANCPIDVKCALHEEQYEFMLQNAIIVDKDFSSVSFVDWSDDILTELVVRRFAWFLRANNGMISQTSEPTASKFLSFVDVGDFDSAFKALFPERILNIFANEEETKRFIVRNTYHLPRQLINICNSISNYQFANEDDRPIAIPFSKENVLRGVADNQSIVCTSLIGANGSLASGLSLVLEAILSSVSRKFSYAEFCDAFEKMKLEVSGASVAGVTDSSPTVAIDKTFKDAVALLDHLLSIGVLGVFIGPELVKQRYLPDADDDGRGQNIYNFAEFRYLSLWKPSYNKGSYFCVHPCFSGWYSLISRDDDLVTCPVDRQRRLGD